MNPNMIGDCWTDLGAWPLENPTGKNWVGFIRELPDGAPGRKRYGEFVAGWTGDDAVVRDRAFLRLIAREYFRVLGEANRRHDPHHLVFGDRLTFQSAIPEVVEEMLPHVDAIAVQPPFQPGFPRQQFERLHARTGKPILICDFAIRFQEEGQEIRGWKPVANADVAGERYAEYVREAFRTPYILGVFWCNPVNSQPGFQKAGIKQGLFAEDPLSRAGLHAAIRELNGVMQKRTPKGVPSAEGHQ